MNNALRSSRLKLLDERTTFRLSEREIKKIEQTFIKNITKSALDDESFVFRGLAPKVRSTSVFVFDDFDPKKREIEIDYSYTFIDKRVWWSFSCSIHNPSGLVTFISVSLNIPHEQMALWAKVERESLENENGILEGSYTISLFKRVEVRYLKASSKAVFRHTKELMEALYARLKEIESKHKGVEESQIALAWRGLFKRLEQSGDEFGTRFSLKNFTLNEKSFEQDLDDLSGKWNLLVYCNKNEVSFSALIEVSSEVENKLRAYIKRLGRCMERVGGILLHYVSWTGIISDYKGTEVVSLDRLDSLAEDVIGRMRVVYEKFREIASMEASEQVSEEDIEWVYDKKWGE